MVFVLTSNLEDVAAQGCSDAGFCTAGALGATRSVEQKRRNELAMEYTFGSGEQGTVIHISQVTYRKQWLTGQSLEVKVPWYFASGELGSINGLGDPIITFSKNVLHKNRLTVRGTAGTRISTGNGNRQHVGGQALPMPYQPNLGTTDFILGVEASRGTYFSAAIGWQQPVFQYNKNDYLPETAIQYKNYFPSRNLRRSSDVLIRVDAKIPLNKFLVGAGSLLIYHITEDKIKRTRETFEHLDGSSGATINLTGFIQYKTDRLSISAVGGSPIVVRTTRPDGLTRAFVLTVSLGIFLR